MVDLRRALRRYDGHKVVPRWKQTSWCCKCPCFTRTSTCKFQLVASAWFCEDIGNLLHNLVIRKTCFDMCRTNFISARSFVFYYHFFILSITILYSVYSSMPFRCSKFLTNCPFWFIPFFQFIFVCSASKALELHRTAKKVHDSPGTFCNFNGSILMP